MLLRIVRLLYYRMLHGSDGNLSEGGNANAC